MFAAVIVAGAALGDLLLDGLLLIRGQGIELRLHTSDEPVARMAKGSFHIAIRREMSPLPKGYVAAPFLGETETPVCSPKLARSLKLKTPADLVRATLLHADTRPAAW